MNLELTDEQVALRDTVRSFLAEKASIGGHVRLLLDDATGTTETVWRGLADLGTTGLLVPTEYDGAGMTMVEAGIVLEELGAGLHPGPWLSSAVAATRALLRFGVDSSVSAPLIVRAGAMSLLGGCLSNPTTWAPSSVSCRTTCAPMPDAQPVTTARRPSYRHNSSMCPNCQTTSGIRTSGLSRAAPPGRGPR